MPTIIAIIGVLFLAYWAFRGINTIGATDDKEQRVRRYTKQMDRMKRK